MGAVLDSVNLPTDLLRTFVTVIDLGGYTRAAEVLGRSQPAVSLQMRRLDELLGRRLIRQQGRRLHLTDDGKVLALYARQMLRLNDEAVGKFRRPDPAGILRVGLPTDFAVSFLQAALTRFAAGHREVELEARCELSPGLMAALQQDQLDIAVAMTEDDDSQYLAQSWIERPVWVAAGDGSAAGRHPLPLVAHAEGCEYRNRMIQALNAARRPWRIAFQSPGISGLQNAVLADLGVSALTKATYRPGMRVLGPAEGFPPLADIRIGLYYKHSRLTEAGLGLVNHLVAALDDLGRKQLEETG